MFVFGATAPSGPGPPHSRGFYIPLNDTTQSIGLLWTSDQLVAETSTCDTQHSQQTNIHTPGGIRTHNLSVRAATNLRLRRHGHRDRHVWVHTNRKIQICAETRCLVDIGILIGVSEVAGSNLGQSRTS